MIRLANSGGGSGPKFPGATLPPLTFLGRYYLGSFAGGSNYTGTINHGLTDRYIRMNSCYRRINNGPGVNEDTAEYVNHASHINLNGYGTCTISHPNQTQFNYAIYLVGNGLTWYYWVDLYGDDGGGQFGSTTVTPEE